ncbi:MAG: MATE family efflux transporter [Lachnospiraceae bacterium]|nr:MATE family efflux transporter [Lachnospiraceae bacterium]
MTHNLTVGNPAKLIFKFAIPLLIGNLFQQLYVMVDAFMVGRIIGVNALASVGSIGSINFLILGFILGVCNGLGILIAQKYGAGDMVAMRRSVATGAVVGVTVAIMLSLVSAPFSRSILELMQTPREIIDGANDYLMVLLWGLMISMLFNLLGNIIRALGDSKTPLYFLAISSVLNIITNYIFIVIIGTGLAGVALGTLISQFASVVMCLIYIHKKLPILRLNREDWQVVWSDIKEHIKVAIPMGFQLSVIAIGAIIVQFVLNGLGSVAVAANTAAGRIDQLAVMPIISFGATMSTYSAQNYGAGKIDRIKKGVFQCCIITLLFCIVMGVIIFFSGYYLSGLFLGEGEYEVQRLSQVFLRINGVMYYSLAVMIIFRFTLQGMGHSFIPMISGFGELVMRIFAAALLVGPLGFVGVCLSNPLAWLGALIPLAIAYPLTMRRLSKDARVPVQQ